QNLVGNDLDQAGRPQADVGLLGLLCPGIGVAAGDGRPVDPGGGGAQDGRGDVGRATTDRQLRQCGHALLPPTPQIEPATLATSVATVAATAASFAIS